MEVEEISTLQEVLAVLIGAESEAKRIIDESKSESNGFLRSVQEKFAAERSNRMASAREQAKGLMETARAAGKTEAAQIVELGKEERTRMQNRYEDNVDPIVDFMVSEIADELMAKGRVKA